MLRNTITPNWNRHAHGILNEVLSLNAQELMQWYGNRARNLSSMKS